MQKNYLDAQTLPSKKPQSFVFCLSVQSRILLCFRSVSLHLPAAAAAAAVLHLLMWRKMARVDYELRVKFKRHRQAFSWSTISPEVVPQVQQSFISSFFFFSPSSELAGWLAGWFHLQFTQSDSSGEKYTHKETTTNLSSSSSSA
jgi:hypothetical protein